MKTIMMIVAYILIFAACDVKRGPDSKIEFMSKEWFLQLALI